MHTPFAKAQHLLLRLYFLLFCLLMPSLQHSLLAQATFSAQVNVNTLIQALAVAPAENSLQQPVSILLPMPDGSFKSFLFRTNALMDQNLATAFPDLKTYSIQSTDDAAIYGRATLSPHGLMATIFSGGNIIEIAPLNLELPDWHLVTERAFAAAADVICGTDDRFLHQHASAEQKAFVSNGSTLRTYRLAIVTTGEYGTTHGGTVSSATAAVVAQINALEAIYVRDLAVRFTLLMPVIYLNPATDPFPSDNLDRTRMAAEAIAANFTPASFDIGHALHSTGGQPLWGGGVAYVGVICINGLVPGSTTGLLKAGAWSSMGSTLTGQLQVLAHEVGHQFSMLHTFNGSGGGCSTNISASSAVEIGSGTTIMSYNGLCSADQNIPDGGVSDLYFHINSLESAVALINTATCSSTVPSGNTPPTVTVNPCAAQTVIPIGTPFRLRGFASDADGDELYYNWEQVDEDGNGTPTQGLIGSLAAASTTAPLFRSYPPGPSPLRTFPNMSLVAANQYASSFEPLPTVARNLRFQFTARDYQTEGGGMTSDLLQITVSSAGPFAVTAPNGGGTLTAGQSTTVTWSVNGTAAFCNLVNIRLSIDGGLTFPYLLADNTPNDGTQSVVIPTNAANSTKARIMVECADNDCIVFFDISNANFTIVSDCAVAASVICPVSPLSLPSGDAGLNLSMTPHYGELLSQIPFVINTGNPLGPLANATTAGGSSCLSSWGNERYATIDFVVETSGVYNFNNTSGGPVIYSVFGSSGYNPASPCSGLFVGSNAFSTISYFTSASMNLTACTRYKLVVWTLSGVSASPVISVSGPGNVYGSGNAPGASYAYTYVAAIASSGVITAVSSTASFSTLSAGNYVIYGVSWYSGTGPAPAPVNTANWIGQSIQQVLATGDCVLFSSNARSITVTGPPCVPATFDPPTVTQPASCSQPTGSIVINTFGINPLQYSIDSGSTWQSSASFAGLLPGSYHLAIRRQSDPSCRAFYSANPVVINLPPGCCYPITITGLSSSNPTCSAANGSISITANGQASLQYSINNGLSWQNSGAFSGLSAGSYQIVVRYLAQTTCLATYNSNPVVLVAQNNPCQCTVYCSASQALGSCGNEDEYIAAVSFAGINNTSSCAQSLPAGYTNYTNLSAAVNTGASYTLTVTNGGQYTGALCRAFFDWNGDGDFTDAGESFTLTGSGLGNIQFWTASITIPAGASTGATRMRIRLTGDGETPAPCGNQSYGETEDYCISISTIQCTPPTVGAPAVTQPTCDVTTGTIIVNATGTGTMEYSVNDGLTYHGSRTFSGLAPGTYAIRVRLLDDPTCNTAYSGNPVTINSPPASPQVNTPTMVQPTCSVPTGSITVNATGSGTLEYSINDGISYQTSALFSGLAAGTYNIRVRLQATPSCTTAFSGNPVTINAGSGAPQLSAPTVTQPSCANNTGIIVVNATAAGTLQYSLNNGINYQLSNTFTGLAPGNYIIRVRLLSDPNCSVAFSGNPVVIQSAPVAPVISEPTVTQPSCASPAGAILVNASGSGTLEYSINDGVSYQASATFSNLSPGSYVIRVRLQSDAACSIAWSSNPVQILAATDLPTIAAPGLTQPTCAFPTGAVTVNATGSGTLEYSIDGGNDYQLSPNFSNVQPGSYQIWVRNQANTTCSTPYSGNPVVIQSPPSSPTISNVAITQPSCAVPSGSVSVSATGSGSLEYSLTSGVFQSASVFNGLQPGTYQLFVRLAADQSCTTTYASNPITISSLPVTPVIQDPTVTQATCNTPTGSLVVNATAFAAMAYSINNGLSFQASPTFSNLNAGSYQIVVRLSADPSCQSTYTGNPVVILPVVPAPIINTVAAVQPDCNNPSGSITINASAAAPIEYSINGGQTYQSTASFSGLTAGSYNVFIRLQADPSCVAIYSANPVIIQSPPTLPAVQAPMVTQPSCSNPTGAIVVNATSSHTLEYSINGGTTYQSLPAFTGLFPGNYSLVVRLVDFPACFSTYAQNPVSIQIAPVAPVINAPTVVQPTCALSSGSITINASGTGVLEYSIDNGQSFQLSSVFSSLSPANYLLRVRKQDDPVCVATYNANPVTINNIPAPPLISNVAVQQPSCGAPLGQITVTASGSGALQYSIDGGSTFQTSGVFVGLSANEYAVVVRLQSDATCAQSFGANPIVISAPASLPLMTAPNVVQPTCTAPAGSITINASGAGAMEYSINGGTSFQSSPVFSGLSAGSYTLQARLLSDTGCIAVYSSNPVQLNPAPGAPIINTVVISQPDCAEPLGTIDIDASGPGTLEYSINGGTNYQLSGLFTGLAPGNYQVAVRPQADPGCVSTYSGNPIVLNTVPAPPAISSVSSLAPTCDTPGVISVQATGAGTLEYSVNQGVNWQTGATFPTLMPGTYAVLVRIQSAPGCVSSYAGNPIVFDVPQGCCSEPEIVCTGQTITFNGEASLSIDPATLVDIQSAECGLAGIMAFPSSFSCQQIGQTIPVTVVVQDEAQNTAFCQSTVTVSGLPCGWRSNTGAIGCNSTVNYTPGVNSWSLSANTCATAPPYFQDNIAFIQRTLCGDGSITAYVDNITTSLVTFAGVTMRETNAPGAKKVALSTSKISTLTRREFRYTTGGQAIPSDFFTDGSHWMRIVRRGNTFTGYVSKDNVHWYFISNVLIPMNACIEIGLFSTNTHASASSVAVFTQVSTTGSFVPVIGAPNPGILPEETLETYDIVAYPNPATDEIFIDMSPYAGRTAGLEIFNFQGQLIRQLMMTDIAETPVRIDMSGQASGVYLLKVSTEGLPDKTLRVILR
jgi:hypothetical protein